MWLPVLNLTDWANLAHQINLSEIFLYCTVGNLKRLHTRPQGRAGEPGTAGSSAPTTRAAETRESHAELSLRPGLQVSQGPGSTAANSQQLETPTRPRAPRGSRGQGEDTLPPRGAGKGRDRNRRLGFPPPSAAHPHGPPRPRNPAPRAFLFAQVRRALSRPGRAARPRPVGSRAAPEWAGGTSVRRRGRGLGAPVPPARL